MHPHHPHLFKLNVKVQLKQVRVPSPEHPPVGVPVETLDPVVTVRTLVEFFEVQSPLLQLSVLEYQSGLPLHLLTFSSRPVKNSYTLRSQKLARNSINFPQQQIDISYSLVLLACVHVRGNLGLETPYFLDFKYTAVICCLVAAVKHAEGRYLMVRWCG